MDIVIGRRGRLIELTWQIRGKQGGRMWLGELDFRDCIDDAHKDCKVCKDAKHNSCSLLGVGRQLLL